MHYASKPIRQISGYLGVRLISIAYGAFSYGSLVYALGLEYRGEWVSVIGASPDGQNTILASWRHTETGSQIWRQILLPRRGSRHPERPQLFRAGISRLKPHRVDETGFLAEATKAIPRDWFRLNRSFLPNYPRTANEQEGAFGSLLPNTANL
jgi:hypothetical protein